MNINKLVIISFTLLTLFSCGKKQVNSAESSTSDSLAMTQPSKIIGIGKIVPQGGISNLAASAAGIVQTIAVKEGDSVHKGDVLLILDNTRQALAVGEISSRIASQQKSIEAALLLIDKEKISLADKLRKLNDAQDLEKSGATSGENVRNLQSDYDLCLQSVKKLQNDHALQQSQLAELNAQKASRNNDLSITTLRSPMNGIVLGITPKEGEAVSQYQVYARLAPHTPLVVKAEIDEMFAAKLAIGQLCEVRLMGESKPITTGKITAISPDLKRKSLFSDSGEDFQDRRIREIEIAIENQTMLLDTKVECTVVL